MDRPFDRPRLRRLAALALTLAIAGEAEAACLRGVNLAGAEFGSGRGTHGIDYIYPSPESIAYYAGKGFNAVRLPFKWERLQPRLGRGFDREERKRLADTVAALRRAGLTVVLDPHNYGRYDGARIGSPEVPDSAFADFWRRLAGDYRDDEGVQFGLMNEPHDMPAPQWLSAANAAIAAIRAAGAGNLVLVPGTLWSGAHSWQEERPAGANGTVMLGVADPAGNYAYEVHQYLDADFSGRSPGCARADEAVAALESFTSWLRRNGRRGFLGEFGGSAEPACLAGLARMVAHVDGASDVWTGWTYWAGGEWWPDDEPLNIKPRAGEDRPQIGALLSAKAGACPAP